MKQGDAYVPFQVHEAKNHCYSKQPVAIIKYISFPGSGICKICASQY